MTGRYGFEDLGDFKPDADGDTPATADVDRAGESAGFTSREPVARAYRHDREKEPTVPLSIRPPVTVANRFIEFCKEERMPYWQGLDELMRRAGK